MAGGAIIGKEGWLRSRNYPPLPLYARSADKLGNIAKLRSKNLTDEKFLVAVGYA